MPCRMLLLAAYHDTSRCRLYAARSVCIFNVIVKTTGDEVTVMEEFRLMEKRGRLKGQARSDWSVHSHRRVRHPARLHPVPLPEADT